MNLSELFGHFVGCKFGLLMFLRKFELFTMCEIFKNLRNFFSLKAYYDLEMKNKIEEK